MKLIKAGLYLGAAAALMAQTAPKGAEAEVARAMEAYRAGMVKKDREGLNKVLHADLTYMHSNGRFESKTDVLDSQKTSGIKAIEFIEPKTRMYGNVALVKTKANFTNVVDGKETVVHLDILHVLVKGSAGWQIVARQPIRLP
jgi:hypothetical protein